MAMDNMESDDCSAPIKQAIELHQQHMADPKTATSESQQELMDLLNKHQTMMGDPDEGDESAMPTERDPYMSENRMPMNLMKRRSMMKE